MSAPCPTSHSRRKLGAMRALDTCYVSVFLLPDQKAIGRSQSWRNGLQSGFEMPAPTPRNGKPAPALCAKPRPVSRHRMRLRAACIPVSSTGLPQWEYPRLTPGPEIRSNSNWDFSISGGAMKAIRHRDLGTGACHAGLAALFDEHGTQVKVVPGAAIVHQGAPSDTVYRIDRGCVRSCVYSENGDRKILRFLRPGDCIGLGDGNRWLAAHEAVDFVVAEAIPRRVFESRLLDDVSLQTAVRHQMAEEIKAHAALLVLTAQTTAVERVRKFLWRYAASRERAEFVVLPMSRRDIADHLGLSMETISRAFTTLKDLGEIELNGASFFRFTSPQAAERRLERAA